MKRTLYHILALLILVTLSLLPQIFKPMRETSDLGESFYQRKITCALDMAAYDDSTKILLTGYNYALLKDFARSMDSEIEIFVAEDGECYADSVRNGTTDIVVIPYRHGHFNDEGNMASTPVDSLTVWMINPENMRGLIEINSWLDKFHKSSKYKKYHRMYVQTFHDPYKEAELGVIRSELSPYDSLFKAYAKTIGWDWKMFAALAFKESKFRIDAHSFRGARGLMQMMPVTADRYAIEDMLDPEQNIRAGVEYVNWLRRVFAKRMPEDNPDMVYFILASYNCGEGHIIDCINYAQYKHVYDNSWASVCHILPDMEQDSISAVDTVKLGKFNAGLVLSYVDEVLSIKEIFDELCPDF